MGVSRTSLIFSTALISLAFSGCKAKRPEAPLENYVAIRAISFNPKRLQEYDGQAEIFMQIETLPSHQMISRSPTLNLAISKTTTFVSDKEAFWLASYADLEKAFLGSGQSGVALSLKAQTDYCRGFWNEDMTAVPLDFHIIPFTKPIQFIIVDKPGPKRSLKEATGAEFVLSLQRELIGGAGTDRPKDNSYPALIESWYLNDKIAYDDYSLYYETTERVFDTVLGADADKIVFQSDDAALKALKKIRAKIEDAVIEQLKTRDREAYAAAIERDPDLVEYSKADLFFKWATTDSDYTLAKNIATEKITSVAQSWTQKFANTSYGAKFKDYLKSSGEKHKVRAVEKEAEAIEYLRSVQSELVRP